MEGSPVLTLPGQTASAPPSSGDRRTQPRFSIVIPARNEEAFLGACLDSLARQDFAGEFEVIVVDNNSTDSTAQIARAHGAKVVREENLGVCWARQCGTTHAAGEIVISTDADTTFHQGWLSRIDAAFRADPRLVGVAGPCTFVDSPLWGRVYARTLFGLVNILRRATGKVHYASATNIAFRKSAFDGYDTGATQGGDEFGVLRQLRAKGKVTFDPGNSTFTSSRRLYRGFVYNVLVTFLFYYMIGYMLNRMLGRTVIGMAPAFRGKPQRTRTRTRRTVERVLVASTGIAVVAAIGGLAIHFVDAI